MALEEISLKDISYLELWHTFFWRKGRFCAILIEGIMAHEEYFCEIILHWTSSSRDVKRYFLSRTLSGAEPFEQFW